VKLPHPEPISGASYSAVELAPGDREVILLDQRRLPLDEEYLRLGRVEDVAVAIETLAVRGAPAIGVAAAYGVVIAAAHGEDVEAGIARLRRTRPTAVNLAWALERMARAHARASDVAALAAEATDSMVAQLMRRRGVDLAVVGADRIARSGDVANKIGTYGVACLAAAHDVPFYVAAPWSTVDLACPDGDAIPIERRAEDEVLSLGGVRVAPRLGGVHADNPAFDVTPARLVRALFTERGEAAPPSEGALLALCAN
jgi:methylthioribose-1-phosphate isomerase